MKRQFISLVLLCLIVVSSEAIACSIEIPPLRKDFRRAESVFVGEVLNVEETALTSDAKAYFPEAWQDWNLFSKIRFKVKKGWKGSHALEREFVGVAFFYCGCPGGPMNEFKVGNEYLVLANSKKFLTVCESEDIGSEFVEEKMKRLDSFWFRTWARIYPF